MRILITQQRPHPPHILLSLAYWPIALKLAVSITSALTKNSIPIYYVFSFRCTICHERFRLMRELRHHYPVHNTSTGSTAATDKETPVVLLTGSADENVDNNINKTASDAHITITFNRNVLENDGTGDITINISPEKIN